MSRLPNYVDRSRTPPELWDAYDRVAALRQGQVSGPYGVLLHSPELAERAAALGEYTRWNSVLSAPQTEVAVLAAAREFDAKVMWAGHVRIGREAGISDATIDAIGRRRDLPQGEEADIVHFVRELLQTHRVSGETFEAVRSRLGDRGVVDLTGLIGYYSLVAAVLNAFEVEPPSGSPELPSV